MIRAAAALATLLSLTYADSSAGFVDRDLLARMYEALDSLHHAENKNEADRDRATIRLRFQEALGFDQSTRGSAISALLYLPASDGNAAPAIMIVRPHEDPRSGTNQKFAASLANAGFVVLVSDLRAHHDKVDLVATGGFAPEALLQHDVRAILDFLSSRADVDSHRIGLIGTGFSAALAVALNSSISVAALEGLPNLREEIGHMALLSGNDLPDPCFLVYGLLRFAATEDLGTMISPRPLLATNPAPAVSDYLSSVYQSNGALNRLRQSSCDTSSGYCSQLVREWIASALRMNGRDIVPSPGSEPAINVSAVEIPVPQVNRGGHKEPLTQETLSSLLGERLPEAHITWSLQTTARPQQVVLTTQPGFSLPATVLRPGPDGGGIANGLLLALFDAGREAILNDEIVQSALRRGWFVWAVDVRGLGSLKSEREGFLFAANVLLGENFAWRQASDVSQILASLRNGSHTHRTGLYARGNNATVIAGYVAATAERDQPEWIVLRDGVDTFSRGNLPRYLVPLNAFDLFDFNDLLKVAKPKIIRLTRPEDFSEDDW